MYRKLLLLASISGVAFAGTTNKHAHVHGAGKITLALESFTEGTIDLDIPAESIYGFEHAANTPAEKAAQAKGLGALKNNPYSVVRLPSDCEVKALKVEMEKEEPGEKEEGVHEGAHADVNASYSVECTSSLAGAKIWVGMFDVFPRVKAVTLQVLSPNGQLEQKITNAHESLVLPK